MRNRRGSVTRGFIILAGLCGCPSSSAPPAEGTTTEAPATDGDGSPGEANADSDGADESGAGTCAPTEASIRETIIAPACATATCHDATTAAGALDLSGEVLLDALANVASGTCDGEVLVVPGQPEASFLIDKLGDMPQCGGPMPPTNALTAAQRSCIEAWIAAAEGTCDTCGGATCIDVETNAEHCGSCDAPCPAGVPCQGGACQCPNGTVACAGTCVDTASDPAHCGACGRPCDADMFCLNAICGDDCGDLTACGGACVDLAVDPLHCGDCNNACGAGEACAQSSCGCDAPPISYAETIEPIMVAECATMGCHRPMGPNEGSADLDLSAGAGYAELVDVPSTQCADRLLVDPGAPGSSYLYDKVLGVNLCSGTIMPKSGPSLSKAELQFVSDWICAGALP